MNTVLLHEYVRLYNDVIPQEYCQHIIQTYESVSEKSKISVDNDGMKFDNVVLNDHSEFDVINKSIYSISDKIVKSYIKSLDLESFQIPETYGWEQIKLKRYDVESGFFSPHVDVMNAETCKRFISVFFYLNDADAGTHFMLGGEEQVITPKAGTAVVFPPMWMFPHFAPTPVCKPKYFMGTYCHYV